MNRLRAGLALLLGQASWCAASRAGELRPPVGKVYRIGVLGMQSAAESAEKWVCSAKRFESWAG